LICTGRWWFDNGIERLRHKDWQNGDWELREWFISIKHTRWTFCKRSERGDFSETKAMSRVRGSLWSPSRLSTWMRTRIFFVSQNDLLPVNHSIHIKRPITSLE
jgi:hypothetical protein